jgi:hypothetical protein
MLLRDINMKENEYICNICWIIIKEFRSGKISNNWFNHKHCFHDDDSKKCKFLKPEELIFCPLNPFYLNPFQALIFGDDGSL